MQKCAKARKYLMKGGGDQKLKIKKIKIPNPFGKNPAYMHSDHIPSDGHENWLGNRF